MTRFLVLVSLVSLAGVAHADDKEKADALFKQGKKLMAEKRYADACEAFEQSQLLDPGIGTQLNAAKCYEEWGKIGRAFVVYQAAEQAAKDANDERAPKIHELVAALEPNVPHLTIMPPKDAPPGLLVTVDGRPVVTLGEAFVIDPGPHTIEWSMRDVPKRTKIVAIDRGGESEVSISVAKPAPAVSEPPVSAVPPPAGHNRRIGALVLGGVGAVAVGVSSFMTLSARSRYHDALDAHCGGVTNGCDSLGLEETHDARSTANKATVVFVLGVAMLGGGAALYFLAPEHPAPARKEHAAFYVTPSLSPDGVGVVLGGAL